jgi:Ni,Fe-hydrogenase III large subunit
VIEDPRAGRPSAVRRWLASTLARELDAFVVPGPEMLDALALDPVAAGLRVVANPRQATVLVLVGDTPPGLARAAAIAHAQQPRPKAMLSVGAVQSPAPLPSPHVSVAATQPALNEGVADLRRRLAQGAWDPDPPAVAIEESHTHMDEMGLQGMRHMAGGSHAGMEHTGGHAGGMMSMATMTADLPRSSDGLPMEWLEVPFGPLFPGLPGGLNLVLTLDGDTVVGADVRPGTVSRDLPATWPGPAETFADTLASLDPLARTAYRVLAWRALGSEPDEREMRRRIVALERDRVASHLTWLGRFGFLLGHAWLAQRASHLARTVRLASNPRALDPVHRFVQMVGGMPVPRWRLEGVGRIDTKDATSGPVARACGRPTDARQDDHGYQALGFAPIVKPGCDAFARLSVRLAEIEQSLELIRAAAADGSPTAPKSPHASGTGRATIETPRGRASLVLTVDEGQVLRIQLEVPSAVNLHLVETVAAGHELADALIGIASLDLSPWELDQ